MIHLPPFVEMLPYMWAFLIPLPLLAFSLQRRSRKGRIVGSFLLLVSLSSLVYIVYLLDVVALATLRSLFLYGVTVVAFGLCGVVYALHHSKITIAVGAAAIACILILRFVDTSARKPFMRFYEGIHAGMPTGDIEDLLAKQFPSRGRYTRPPKIMWDVFGLELRLEPQDGTGGTERIGVLTRGDEVADRQYIPDSRINFDNTLGSIFGVRAEKRGFE